MTRNFDNAKLIGIAVFIAGLVLFASIVKADSNNVNTSVTVTNASPSITNLSLNDATAITVLESTSQIATTTFTVTDTNGCSSINYVQATVYLASTSNSGTTCTANDNSCYTEFVTCFATSTDTCDGGLDSSVDYECGFRLWYIAEATDGTGDWASSIWSAAATASDGLATTTATNTTESIEVNTLRALAAGPAIAYGSLGIAGTSAVATTSATSTGNVIIDVSLQATNDMCDDYPTCASNYILSTQQEYTLATGWSYGAGTDLASSSAGNLNTTLTNPTATTSDPIDFIEWMLQIPSGTVNAAYTGVNVFTAIAPQ